MDIDIPKVNDPPVAVDDSFQVKEDTEFIGKVCDGSLSDGAPDSDPDFDKLTVVSHTNPTNGIIKGEFNSDTCKFKYVPNPNYNGPDSFTYKISDGNGLTDEAKGKSKDTDTTSLGSFPLCRV